MKKLLLIGLVLLVVAGFAFAGGQGTGDGSGEEKFRVGVAAPYMDPPYDAAFWRMWDKLVKEKPYSDWEIIITDAQGDLNNQINQIEDLARKEIDVLLVKPLSAAGVVPTLNKVWEASGKTLPIITVNLGTDPAQIPAVIAHTGPNYYLQGLAAGEGYVKYLDAHNLDKVNYCILLGRAGSDATNLRKQGFLDKVEEMGASDRFVLLDEQPADWYTDLGQQVAENWITSFGDKMDMIYAENDDMGIGAVNALKGAGYEKGEVLVNGVDAGFAGTSLVKEGWMTFVVLQSPMLDAEGALHLADKLRNGEKIEEFFNYIPSPIITAENADEWLPKIKETWGL